MKGFVAFAVAVSIAVFAAGCGGGGSGGSGGSGGAGGAACESHASKRCSAAGVYWYDSCGNQQERILVCSADETCVGDACVDLWEKTIGGTNVDRATDMAATPDGGLAVAGFTQSEGAGSSDFFLVKLDASGDEEWSATFGGTSRDEALAVANTSDGGFILAGYTQSTQYGISGTSDAWVVKTDSNGGEEWNANFGGSGEDAAAAIRQTSDGGYIAAGYTSDQTSGDRDIHVVRLDSAGNVLWERTHEGMDDEEAMDVAVTVDGGFIVAGGTYSEGEGSADGILIKYDASGAEEWARTYGGADWDSLSAVAVHPDGGYVAAGGSASDGADGTDFWALRVDANGAETWSRTYGGGGSDMANSLARAAGGGWLLAGETGSYGESSGDFWVIHVDDTGAQSWGKAFGGSRSDWAAAVAAMSDGLAVAGPTFSTGAGSYDFWVLRIGPNGMSESCPYACCENSDCGGIPTMKYCINASQENSRCVQCLSDAQCNGSRCDMNTYTCKSCTPNASRQCNGNIAYWRDACGNWQSVAEDCDSTERCADGYCVTLPQDYKLVEPAWYLSSLSETQDGGFVAMGYFYDDTWRTFSSLYKVDMNGVDEWTKTSDAGGYWRSAVQTQDGGYVITAYENGSGKIIKLTPTGSEQWTSTISGYQEEIVQTADGGYALFSRWGNAVVVKLDSAGTQVWRMEYMKDCSYGQIFSIDQVPDGGLILGGICSRIEDENTKRSVWAAKTDMDGNQEWETMDFPIVYNINPVLARRIDGGYIVVATYFKGKGGPELSVATKLDEEGETEYSKGVFGLRDRVSDVCVNERNQIAIAGRTAYGYGKAAVCDEDINFLWSKESAVDFEKVACSEDGFVFGGDVYDREAGHNKAAVVKYDRDGNYDW